MLQNGALVTGGRGADVSLAPASRQAHFLAQQVLLPLCLPCRVGRLDPPKARASGEVSGASGEVTPLSWHVPP